MRPLSLALVTILFAWFTFRHAREHGDGHPLLQLARSAFRPPRAWAAHLGAGLAIGAAIVVLPTFATVAGGLATLQPQEARDAGLAAVVASLGLVATWAALEEFIFRGVLLTNLARLRGPAFGLVTSAVLFTLPHVGARHGRFEDPASIATWFVDGLAYGLAYLATGSLWLPTAWHAGKNLAVWLVLDSSTLAPAPGWFGITYARDTLIGGGPGRAGLLDVAAAGVACLAAWAWWKSRASTISS